MRRVLSIVAVCLTFFSSQSFAATVQLVSKVDYSKTFDYSACNIRLVGPIQQGDLQQLRQAINQLSPPSDDPAGVLCLDSPGGSYQEGLRIADFMLSKRLSTFVEADAHCYSACALIFMTGGDNADGRAIVRAIHVQAQLGFHAPNLKDSTNTGPVADAFKAGVQAIRDLAKLGQRHRVRAEFLPKSIIAELLTKGPNEVFAIDTVYKAIQTNISLYGVPTTQVTVNGLGNACQNLHANAGIDVSLDDPPEIWQPSRGVTRSGKQYWFKEFGGEGSNFCLANVPGSYAKFDIAARLLPSMRARTSDTIFVAGEDWYLFPPATPIRAFH